MAKTDAEGGHPVAIQNGGDRAAILARYGEIEASGKLAEAIVIVAQSDGKVDLLAHGTSLPEVAALLLVGMDSIRQAMQGPDTARTPEAAKAAQRVPFGYPGEPAGYINKGWRSYTEAAMPLNAPVEQRTECRRAFYGGAMAMMSAIIGDLSPGDDIQQSDLDKMDRLKAELMAFAEALRRGQA